MRKLCLICLTGVIALAAEAGPSADIEWNPSRVLTWDDFVGPVPANADPERVAATAASLSWSYAYALEQSPEACAYRILDIQVAATFHPDESWVRPGHRSAAVLSHEQGHFDIAELYKKRFEDDTRELVASVRECRGRNERKISRFVERDLNDLIGSVFDEIWRAYRARQDVYDEETRHGMNAQAQASWTEQLESLRQPSTPAQ
jgi:hypothetical protein